jgi:4-hydroxythreonine-4-phosphate dehydrogenase
VVIGDHDVFEQTAKRLHRRLPSWQVVHPQERWPAMKEPLMFLDCGHPATFTPGRSSQQAGKASLAYLDHAISLWRGKRLQALVTAPVTKWAIGRVDPTFMGQTEYLCHAMGTRDVVMMFVSDRLRVALLTRHIPLTRVARAIDRRLVRTTLRLTAKALRTHFKVPHPTLALCGLNPHAGEGSRCGSEERTIMLPVLRALKQEGFRCDGPFAADGFFACLRRASHARGERGGQARVHAPARLGGSWAGRYDAVVCGYHDQGLIPFKMAARDRGCQLSVGLPIVRTSPDHGSALDIAGEGIAHPGSMRYALDLAIKLAQG